MMKLMVNRFLWMLLVCILCLPAAAEAASSHEIVSISSQIVEDDGTTLLRTEIALSKGEANYAIKTGSVLYPNRLTIELENTQAGRVQREMRLDPVYAKSLRLRPLDTNTQVLISLAALADEGGYEVYSLPADKKTKQPFRIVVDVFASPGTVQDESCIDGLKGRRIVIDPGHGGTDSGAVGPSRVREKDVTLAVALKLRDILKNSGAIVVLTREDDRDVWGPTATDAQELQARADVAEHMPGAEIFLSIHCNAFSSPSSHGTETYYYEGKSWLDKLFAENLHELMLEHGGLHDRGVKSARFYVLRHTSMPAALVELAFITNYEEEALLASEAFQDEMATALAQGMANYFAVSGT